MRRLASSLIAGALALGIVAAPVAASGGSATIYDIASSSSSFDTLTAAVDAAGLDGLLDGKRQYTVFAPTDDAFAALEAACPGITAALLADTGSLTKVLAYHVAHGSRDAADVTTSSRIRTLARQFVRVDGTVLNGTTSIVAADVFASNGVVHVIDSVLVPAGLPSSITSHC
jgi:uncharacterized surface protein with fasciclin (FAS1) repeats